MSQWHKDSFAQKAYEDKSSVFMERLNDVAYHVVNMQEAIVMTADEQKKLFIKVMEDITEGCTATYDIMSKTPQEAVNSLTTRIEALENLVGTHDAAPSGPVEALAARVGALESMRPATHSYHVGTPVNVREGEPIPHKPGTWEHPDSQQQQKHKSEPGT